MCKNSFVTVTDTQMQYLPTNVRQNLGFHHPPDIRTVFKGVWLMLKTRSSAHSWVRNVIFFMFWRETYKKSVLYPQGSLRSEGHQNDIMRIMTWHKHWNNHWNEKNKISNVCENHHFFLINLSKKFTVCCKWLRNLARWCQ